MTKINHIVFDIGGVLLHYDRELPFKHIIPDSEKRRWFLDTVCTSEWNIEQDRGRPWPEAETLLISKYPHYEAEIRAFRTHWHEMVPYEYPGTVPLMDALIGAGHDVTLLTNFASDTYREAEQRFEFLKRPRGVTVSGDIAEIKPSHAIYDHHVASFDLQPAAALFIDDSQKNVDGAIEAGWNAVLFTGADTLRADLKRLGVGA